MAATMQRDARIDHGPGGDPAPSLTVDVGVPPGEAPPQTAATRLRADIQLLRAWAVLTIVWNHARLPGLPGGFLGVDIFFVISGFLMTGLIDEALVGGRFRFGAFYARRVRRLLPAAYATLSATALAAPLLLDATEYRDFAGQLVGAFTFTANVVLWKQASYFGSQALLKPLLHIWSLSLEEQYYLFLPLALWLCPRRLRLPLGVAVVAVSGALCAAVMTRSVTAAFYLLPTRAWELAIGSTVALLVRREIVAPRPMAAARWACVAVLVGAPALASEHGHPGVPAALACLATAVLLVPGAAVDRRGIVRPLAAIGDRSYSLYLVHWPLLAFAANAWATPVPLAADVALVAMTFALTELQHRLVEQPFRRFAVTPRSIAVLLLIPALLIGATYAYAPWKRAPDAIARAGGAGLSPACDYRGDFVPIPACTSGAAPDTLVWGDSIAMALAPGLAATASNGIVQATRPVCGPILGLTPLNGAQYNRGWAERCAAFNQSVLAWLARNPRIRTVVLSTLWVQYVPGSPEPDWRVLRRTPAGLVEAPRSRDALLAALADTVARVRATGKRVVLVAPPPASETDAARCAERRAEGRPVLGAPPDCSFAPAAYRRYRAAVLAFLDDVRAARVVPVLDFDRRLCGRGRCVARLGGTLLYRDQDHLGTAGSIALARDMGWGALVGRTAR